MEVHVTNKRQKVEYVLFMNEEDGEELQRLLAPREDANGGLQMLGTLPLYEIQKRNLKTTYKLVLRGSRREMWLGRWVAERLVGRRLETSEKVSLEDGNPCNLQRNNIRISTPKGVWKNNDVAWVVRIKKMTYVCVKKENGEKTYIRCGERDPEEVRQEWLQS